MRTTLDVVSALILENGTVLAAQRGHGAFAGKWEFPGGKIEPGEAPEAALVREIREELDADIEIDGLYRIVEHDYEDFRLRMRCYRTRLASPTFSLLEHRSAFWADAEDLGGLDWVEADIDLVEQMKRDGLVR
ncbi:MAG: (deoxy)nucleoside triphosphate pyrophosphohydrolase [Berryella intestinalis]|uniref:(deoxy)nucleoside triphosphate pyrophosphohydrolase n=1 Tax=Berryella intestinalis TaxID=1531429 RepID=UPI002A51FFCB|nr:(deoxy)nucleoside triphosphate pyrophosphohydrolase [Berryella intestinalis]MDD7369978.1 (deoxy)nucleoside triphosphate pyrophosphohydrolase [Berryella intestinalis]MDY3129156.1 (deoxy)nucleoside triphosphate pyrophosphohydrolase [Berryella intestinalis]